jgi:hypothetical protein
MAGDELPFRITVDDDGSQVVEKFGQKVDDVSEDVVESTEEMQDSFDGLTDILGKATMAAAALAAGTIALTKRSIDAAEGFDKMSQRTGFTVEALSTLAFVAEQSGSSIQVMEVGLKRFSRNILDAGDGIKGATKGFERMGIDVRDASGALKSSNVLLLEASDAFSKMENETLKVAAAQQLFGKAGADLIPLLNSGAAGIASLQAQARGLGLEFSTKTSKAAAAFLDDVNALEKAWTGFGNRLARDTLPLLNRLSKAMLGGQKRAGLFGATVKGLQAIGDEFFQTNKIVIDGQVVAARGTEAILAEVQRRAEELDQQFSKAQKARVGFFQTFKTQEEKEKKIAEIFQERSALLQVELDLERQLEEERKRRAEKPPEDKKPKAPEGPAPETAAQEKAREAREKAAEEAAAARQKELEARQQFADQLIRQAELVGLDEIQKLEFVFREREALVRGNAQAEAAALTLLEEERNAILDKRAEDDKKREEEQAEKAAEVLEAKRLEEASEFERLQIEKKKELDLVGENEAAIAAIEAKFAKKHTDLKNKTRQADIKRTADTLGKVADLTEKFGTKGFEAAKKIRIAEAVINTFAGATNALRLPFPKNLAALAKVIATGKKQIQTIKSATPGGGGGGGGGGAGGGEGAPAAPAPPTPVLPEPPIEAAGVPRAFNVDVSVAGFVGDEAELSSSLASVFREAVGDDVDLGVETTR